jgi:hypothetical protein
VAHVLRLQEDEMTEDHDHLITRARIEQLGQKVKRKPIIEQINHPTHYGGADNPYEAIKVIDAWDLGFCLGNTVKYISRAGKKGDRLEDLQKARWYLDHEIENLEKEKR